jgi:SAM-dependent methyltransferase
VRLDAPGYLFDGAAALRDEHHRCRSEVLDPLSVARLAGTGVGDGWRCLDVGTGGGSVARWLATRVAPSGGVLATDLRPEPLADVPGLRVLRHDIARDPLPETGFDLVHARLVLQFLPEREEVLARLAGVLRPGGWLLVDEFDTGYGPAVLGDDGARAAYRDFVAAKDRVFRAAGGDPTWGGQVAQGMRDAGLTDVDAVVRVGIWRGGSPGARLQCLHTHLAGPEFRRAGLTDRRLAEIRLVLSDPEFQFVSPVRYNVLGRRAG